MKINLNDGCCCQPPVSGLRMLTFPDGSQVGITGLDTAMENLYREEKPLNDTIGQELMERLKVQNYFAPSARQAYDKLLWAEYKRFLESKLISRE